MVFNKKLLNLGIILIGLTLTVCLILARYLYLKEPVFFKHYYELPITDDNNNNFENTFQLQYIANVSDTRKVVGISFKEAPELYFYASETKSNQTMFTMNLNTNNTLGEKHGRYRIRTVNITVDANSELNLEEVQLSQAVIQFNKGGRMEADIGKIILYKENYSQNCLEMLGSSYSSDGTSSSQFTVRKELTLDKLYSPLIDDDTYPLFEVKIDGMIYTSAFDKIYNVNKILTISSFKGTPNNILQSFTIYDVRPKLIYHDNNGVQYSNRVYNLFFYKPQYNSFDLIQYLRARGKL